MPAGKIKSYTVNKQGLGKIIKHDMVFKAVVTPAITVSDIQKKDSKKTDN